MDVRVAQPEDAAAMADVLRRSITELCWADHNNDAQVLAGWLANKTPEVLKAWIARMDHHFLVAQIAGRIAGVGAASRNGNLLLNYVCPDHWRMGISTALLEALETYMISQGVQESRLESTATAQKFYRRRGYRDEAREGGRGRLMRKQLRGEMVGGRNHPDRC